MFKQDVFIADKDADTAVVFLITDKADAVLKKAKSLWDIRVTEKDGLRSFELPEKQALLLYRHANRVLVGIDCHYDPDMPYEIAVLNSRYLADEARLFQTRADVSEYFVPLFDAAIKARDKVEISRLFFLMPNMGYEKSFIIDRLKYGPDAFPELMREGVTLDNWHKETA